MGRIIVGVKYYFRRNRRNRQLRDEDMGEPINMMNIHRTHRRKKEKKLMTMDEVNEQFPLVKYKVWRSTRENDGLPTSGGITAPKMPQDINDPTGFLAENPVSAPQTAQLPSKGQEQFGPNIPRSDSDRDVDTVVVHTEEKIFDYLSLPENGSRSAVDVDHSVMGSSGDGSANNTSQRHEDTGAGDDLIGTAVPAGLLPDPGDTCAVCLDSIEEDDIIRGLTCGHVFHASCVDPWLTSRRACCPLCKADYYVPKPRTDATHYTLGSDQRGRRVPTQSPTLIPPQAVFTGNRIRPFRSRTVFPTRLSQMASSEGADAHLAWRESRGVRDHQSRSRHGLRTSTVDPSLQRNWRQGLVPSTLRLPSVRSFSLPDWARWRSGTSVVSHSGEGRTPQQVGAGSAV